MEPTGLHLFTFGETPKKLGDWLKKEKQKTRNPDLFIVPRDYLKR